MAFEYNLRRDIPINRPVRLGCDIRGDEIKYTGFKLNAERSS
jgi:hypothetical protein